MKKMAFMAVAFLVAVCVLLTGCGKKLNGDDGKTLGVTHKEFVSLYNKSLERGMGKLNGDFEETTDNRVTRYAIELENGIQISTSTKEGEENIFSISLLGKRGDPQFYNYAEKLLLCLEGAEKTEVEEFVTEMKAESASNKRHDKLKNWEKLQTTIGKFKVMFSVVQSLDQDTMYIKFDDGRW